MQEKIRKFNFSDYKNDKFNNLVVEGTNWSSIVSMLIDITARKCDYYKSDIVWDINTFTDAVDNATDYDKILVFRECGVTSIYPDDLINYKSVIESSKYIYELVYDAKIQLQSLIRKDIIFSKI